MRRSSLFLVFLFYFATKSSSTVEETSLTNQQCFDSKTGESYKKLSVVDIATGNIDNKIQVNAVNNKEENHEEDDDDEEEEEEKTLEEYKEQIALSNKIEFKRCEHIDERCELLAEMGECEENPTYMLRNCEKSCDCIESNVDLGIDQAVGFSDAEKNAATLQVINSSVSYYVNDVFHHQDYRKMAETCKNNHLMCSYWAGQDECTKDAAYMAKECSLACLDCFEKEIEIEGCEDYANNCAELKEADRCFFIEVIPVCRKTCGNCVAKSDYGVEQEITGEKKEQIEIAYNASVAFYESEIVYYPEFPRVRDNCKNKHALCTFWAATGECEANPKFMKRDCSLACQTCLELEVRADLCRDDNEFCPLWTKEGKCATDAYYMQFYCARSCKSCVLQIDLGEDQIYVEDKAKEATEFINSTLQYYLDEVLGKDDYVMVRRDCKNRHEMCSVWAMDGECEANPYFMKKHCAIACKTCLDLDMKHRCPIDPDEPVAWQKGDLNKMFQRIVTDPELSKYKPVVLSKPIEDTLDVEVATKARGPWIITLDEFISSEEADRLVEMGHAYGYQRSQNVGNQNWDGSYKAVEDKSRTSTNAWCGVECENDPLVAQVIARIENVTHIPSKNQENLQLLRYEAGQYYKPHHDYIPHHFQRQMGPRILTFFLYLNDVPEGGGTQFTSMDITIMPKKGKAVLWPSVMDENPMSKDFRTDHAALTVEKGVKYGANAWVHLRDVKGPTERGCE